MVKQKISGKLVLTLIVLLVTIIFLIFFIAIKNRNGDRTTNHVLENMAIDTLIVLNNGNYDTIRMKRETYSINDSVKGDSSQIHAIQNNKIVHIKDEDNSKLTSTKEEKYVTVIKGKVLNAPQRKYYIYSYNFKNFRNDKLAYITLDYDGSFSVRIRSSIPKQAYIDFKPNSVVCSEYEVCQVFFLMIPKDTVKFNCNLRKPEVLLGGKRLKQTVTYDTTYSYVDKLYQSILDRWSNYSYFIEKMFFSISSSEYSKIIKGKKEYELQRIKENKRLNNIEKAYLKAGIEQFEYLAYTNYALVTGKDIDPNYTNYITNIDFNTPSLYFNSIFGHIYHDALWKLFFTDDSDTSKSLIPFIHKLEKSQYSDMIKNVVLFQAINKNYSHLGKKDQDVVRELIEKKKDFNMKLE